MVADVTAYILALVEAIVHVRHAYVVHVHGSARLHSFAFHVRSELVRIVHDVRIGNVLRMYATASLNHW